MNGNLTNLSKAQFDFRASNCSYSSEPAGEAHVRPLAWALKHSRVLRTWDCFDKAISSHGAGVG